MCNPDQLCKCSKKCKSLDMIGVMVNSFTRGWSNEECIYLYKKLSVNRDTKYSIVWNNSCFHR